MTAPSCQGTAAQLILIRRIGSAGLLPKRVLTERRTHYLPFGPGRDCRTFADASRILMRIVEDAKHIISEAEIVHWRGGRGVVTTVFRSRRLFFTTFGGVPVEVRPRFPWPRLPGARTRPDSRRCRLPALAPARRSGRPRPGGR